MNAEACAKIINVTEALISRNDFWESVVEAGWILPAEIDDVREALQAIKERK